MTTPTPAQQLEPCPFCGSESIDPRGWASENSSGPACDDCGASAGCVSNRLQDNIAAWNRRTPNSRALAALEAVERADTGTIEVNAGEAFICRDREIEGREHGQRVLIIPADAVEVKS